MCIRDRFCRRRRWTKRENRRHCIKTGFLRGFICFNSLLFTTHQNIDELCQHVTGRNARFSNFSHISADDVIETKKRYRRCCFSTQKCRQRPFTRCICYYSLLHTTHRNTDELCQHDTEHNAQFSNFSPSFADDVDKQKERIGDIVLAQKKYQNRPFKGIYLFQFSAVYNTSKYWRTLSARNRVKCAIFGFFAK